MNTKLTVTFALATSMLGGAAHAFDTLDEVSFDDKLAIDEASSSIDTMWTNKDGQQAADALFGAVLVTPDTLPTCQNLAASKSLYRALRSESLANQTVSVGLEGEAKLIADSTQLAAQVAFGPAVEFLGGVHRPVDVRITAATKPGGLNSLDLGFYAFGYEIDSYNLASSSNPIQHVASHNWTMPYVPPTGSFWNGGFGCGIIPFVKGCRLNWKIDYAVVANLSAILVLKVNSTGVEAHAMTSGNSHFALMPTGTITGQVDTGDEYEPFSFTASGTGVITLGQAYFATHGVLKPKDDHWNASLDVGYTVENLLSAKASVGGSVFGKNVSQTLFERAGQSFADAYYHACQFNKQF
jgi:hypothetical protein